MNKEELVAAVQAKSDQIDADDLIGGITLDVTIKAVQRGPSAEQPLQLVLEETPKFYRPSKTYRRALIGCFGDEPANWVGKRLRLVRNPDTMFGGVKVGGIEVSHASITEPVMLMLSAKRGKKTAVKIDVMPKAAKVAPAPKPKPKAATITGDQNEGDLSEVAPLRPEPEALSKMLAAFAGLGMDEAAVEKEYGKPLASWTIEDMAEAREVFKACKVDWELKQVELKSSAADEVI